MSDFGSVKWGEFRISEIFEIVDGYYNKKPPQDSKGKIPFLGATQYDNGITAFYDEKTIMQYDKVGNLNSKDSHKRIYKGNCLAITNNGSVGNVYYQKADFVCSHDVTPIYLKHRELNRKIAMFLIVVLQKSGESFGYAKKWRPKRMKNSKVLLPLDSKGEPNWAFMESYMKDREKRKLQIIISHFNAKLNLSSLRGGGGGIPELATTRFHRGRPHENRTRAIEFRGNPMGRVCSY